ncbi:MAG: alkylresorcinol/alkylpyrone synthase [Planctomycetota bacterium]|jgi:alkylresorcinol/alkylpyrone synthase
MRIAAVSTALPPHCYSQDEITLELQSIWKDRRSAIERLSQFHGNSRVSQRHLALPLEEYRKPRTFGESNDHWIRISQELGEEALQGALDKVGLTPKDVDIIFAVSVTGIASPSLDARLANRMGFRSDVKRVPIFGLGCVGGAAGIARAADYVKAYPDQVAVLVAVELCTLTFQATDTSVANMISTGLFGDGAAAVVVLGEERANRMNIRGLKIQDTQSVFYHDTEDLMGWKISERGFDIVLSPAVPTVAREQLVLDADRFLSTHDLTRADIATWVCHPGGPKVLSAMQAGLELSDDDVKYAWQVLDSTGNLSSTSVLMVLNEFMNASAPATGARGVLVAMGPAFCSEFVLFEW